MTKRRDPSTSALEGLLVIRPAPRNGRRELAGAALAAANAAAERKAKGEAKPPKVGKPCRCGCGETTKGGTFVTGHDARHKSNLCREAIAGNAEAEAELAERGWTKFLDKARETAGRRTERQTTDGARRQAAERTETDQEKAARALASLNAMKQARLVLIGLGRYGRSSGDRQISLEGVMVDGKVTVSRREVAESILDGTHPELDRQERVLARKLAKEID